MALDQSALTDLLDALRVGGDLDFMREAMQLVLQALIDLEASQVVGAARNERTDSRTTHRNGSRPSLLPTKAGDVDLAIPKLRHGSFFPSLLEWHRPCHLQGHRRSPRRLHHGRGLTRRRGPLPDQRSQEPCPTRLS